MNLSDPLPETTNLEPGKAYAFTFSIRERIPGTRQISINRWKENLWDAQDDMHCDVILWEDLGDSLRVVLRRRMEKVAFIPAALVVGFVLTAAVAVILAINVTFKDVRQVLSGGFGFGFGVVVALIAVAVLLYYLARARGK